MTADVLTARFTDDGKQSQLSGVDGAGRTIVERSLTDNTGGVAGPLQWHETGTGDTLKMDFRTVPGVGPMVNGKAPAAKSQLSRAEQRGSVLIVAGSHCRSLILRRSLRWVRLRLRRWNYNMPRATLRSMRPILIA